MDDDVSPPLSSGTRTVVWFRRDLRLEDNPALAAAVNLGSVIPVFVWSPEEEGQFYPGRVSRWWLKQSLTHLDSSLKALGSRLVMRRAVNTFPVLLDIIQTMGATHLFYNHLYDPISLVRDHRVKQGMSSLGVVVHTFNADLLYEPWEVYDQNGLAFTTFDSFWEKCLSMPFEPDPPLSTPASLKWPGAPLPSLSAEDLGLEDEQEKSSNALLARAWAPGCENADKALETFLKGSLKTYATCRVKAESGTTSLLSPHLHFGEISVRRIFHSAKQIQRDWKEAQRSGKAPPPTSAEVDGDLDSVDHFLRSVGLREYSRYLSFNFPFTHERSLLSNLKSFPWRVDEACFKAWRQGRTGYPLIDAGMRELWATGWLHNRVRVTVASFCVKFLRLPWRWGMKYFWDTLLDADLESDVLGWQYISGSLPDGHELDRMENPEVEGIKFDPEGNYVRRWIPELARLPSQWIHHPWDAPPQVLQAGGVELGFNYPWPIVGVQEARERLQEALLLMWEREAALRALRANAGGEGQGETEGEAPSLALPSRTVVRGEGGAGQGEGSQKEKDQRVPSLLASSHMPAPSEDALQASHSILNRGAAEGQGGGQEEEGRQRGEESTAMRGDEGIQPPYPAELDHFAEEGLYQPFGQRLYLTGGMGPKGEEGEGESTAESGVFWRRPSVMPQSHSYGPLPQVTASAPVVPVWSQSVHARPDDPGFSEASHGSEPLAVVPCVAPGFREEREAEELSDRQGGARAKDSEETMNLTPPGSGRGRIGAGSGGSGAFKGDRPVPESSGSGGSGGNRRLREDVNLTLSVDNKLSDTLKKAKMQQSEAKESDIRIP